MTAIEPSVNRFQEKLWISSLESIFTAGEAVPLTKIWDVE
jgi:hypothetical protein